MHSRRLPRILFVAPAVPPIAVAESIAVLKRLRVLAGHLDLTVVAADDRGGGFAMKPDAELTSFLPESARVIRVPWLRAGRWQALIRAAQAPWSQSGITNVVEIAWAIRALRFLRHRHGLSDIDGVISNSSPAISHLVASRVRRRLPGVPWVQHYSDPLVDVTYGHYQPLSFWVDTRFEQSFLARADLVTVTSPETRDLLAARYAHALPGLASRLAVVPNVYDSVLFEAATTRYADVRPFSGSGHVNVTCLGHFYGKRSIAPVCRWMDWIRAQPSSRRERIHLHIFGSLRAAELDLVRSRYADRIEFHEPVGYLHSLAIMKRSDALLVVDAPTNGPSVHFPSKLAEYLGANRPIIAFTPGQGATARIVRETGHLAVPTEPGPEHFTHIDEFLSRWMPGGRVSEAYANDERHCASIIEVLTARSTRLAETR
jgi:glycosyl transferase family 4